MGSLEESLARRRVRDEDINIDRGKFKDLSYQSSFYLLVGLGQAEASSLFRRLINSEIDGAIDRAVRSVGTTGF